MLLTAHNRIKQTQNYVLRKKLKEDCRRRRGPVVQAVAENVFRKQRSGRSQTGFDGRGLDDSEIGTRRHPPGSVSIEVLPFGINRSPVN
jgi:hypothetical protein